MYLKMIIAAKIEIELPWTRCDILHLYILSIVKYPGYHARHRDKKYEVKNPNTQLCVTSGPLKKLQIHVFAYMIASK